MAMLHQSLLKVRPISWQKVLEDLRLLIGLFNKVKLIITDGLTKEFCIGSYLFAKQVAYLGRKSGWLFVALYLKQCSASLMQWYARETPTLPEKLSVPISLTRLGLPRIIPPFHRKIIRRRDERSDTVVKFYLSLFTLAKVIRLAKRVTKATFHSLIDPPDAPLGVSRFVQKAFAIGEALLERYAPKIREIPLLQGMSWDPTSGRPCRRILLLSFSIRSIEEDLQSKVPLSIMMIGVDGRARTGIIAGTARSGPTIFKIYIYMDIRRLMR